MPGSGPARLRHGRRNGHPAAEGMPQGRQGQGRAREDARGQGRRDLQGVDDVGQHFKQSGMIWSLKGAKALLPLRTRHKSNRLEEFFAYLVRDLRQVDCAA